jgi:hypothetical protein
MGKMKEFELVIADFVGYSEELCVDDKGQYYTGLDCADPELYDKITEECSKCMRDEITYDDMSPDAQHCWDEAMERLAHGGSCSNYDEAYSEY